MARFERESAGAVLQLQRSLQSRFVIVPFDDAQASLLVGDDGEQANGRGSAIEEKAEHVTHLSPCPHSVRSGVDRPEVARPGECFRGFLSTRSAKLAFEQLIAGAAGGRPSQRSTALSGTSWTTLGSWTSTAEPRRASAPRLPILAAGRRPRRRPRPRTACCPARPRDGALPRHHVPSPDMSGPAPRG